MLALLPTQGILNVSPNFLNPQRHSGWRVLVIGTAPAIVFVAMLLNGNAAWAETSLATDLAAVKQIGPEAAGYEAATAAAKRLSLQPSSSAATILAAMKDASPLAKNWLRMIAADVADNDSFPSDLLLDLFADRSQDNDARHAAYQMLIASNPALQAKLLAGANDDPSLPVRHAAIAMILDQAAKQKEAGDKPAAIESYQTIITQARNPDQLQAAAKALADLGEEIELADELGLIRRWWGIGTFDNTASTKFDTAYLPEQVIIKDGRLPIAWLQADAVLVKDTPTEKALTVNLVTSEDSFGIVNINPAFNNAKDSIAYCYVEFEVANPVEAVARLGCITASKVWVNGKLTMANEVYHSGTRIDQYLGDCQLVSGLNTVLIKICQNAQTEPWAQDWQFQFRLTDRMEAAVKPTSLVQPK